MKNFITIKRVILTSLVVLIDLAVYIFLGLVLLNYEDFYNESEGPYWSLKSMTLGEKAAYIGYYFWIVLNVLVVLFILYRVIKYFMINLKSD